MMKGRLANLPFLLMFTITSLVQFSCAKDDLYLGDPISGDRPLVMHLPKHFPALPPVADNPITEKGFTLGRALFYEPLLSANKQVSCATCHNQQKAFSDGLILSNTGISGKALERHSPVLFNLAWAEQGYFWDGGSKNLESQAFGPLTHPDEMGIFFPEMTSRLQALPQYVELFRSAFNEPPTAAGVAKALAQFQRTLVSATSKYDSYREKENTSILTRSEIRGYKIVRQKCTNCHQGELFTDNDFHNNGLDVSFTDDTHEEVYLGRFRITRNEADKGLYKTPSLRNVMVSGPYMHDGRFATIDDVLDHYRYGVQAGATTDVDLLNDDGKYGITLSDQEVADIKAFLHTLTDTKFLQNTAFKNPHKT